jgi:hydroxymethylpyrimidine/phosphomethylpyrimidine kinase
MVSTSGAQLLPQEAISTLIKLLLPLTTVLTPNLPEAKLLLQSAGVELKDPENVEDIVAMAHKIQGLGPRWVLLKGGRTERLSRREWIDDNGERVSEE